MFTNNYLFKTYRLGNIVYASLKRLKRLRVLLHSSNTLLISHFYADFRSICMTKRNHFENPSRDEKCRRNLHLGFKPKAKNSFSLIWEYNPRFRWLRCVNSSGQEKYEKTDHSSFTRSTGSEQNKISRVIMTGCMGFR